jgi:oligogalacturonide transport system permease protein
METKKRIADCCKYLTLILVGIVMIYPLVWMIGASFKSNAEIFSSIGFIPKNPTLEGYQKALSGYGGDIDIWKALLNTYKIVIPKVIFTVCSCTIAAYGFARFKFIGHDFFFALLMSTLFLPNVVLNVPQFIMYNKFGWVDSPIYLPLIVSTLFAQDTYFVFMLIQFMRNIPKELDEAAKIDGCNAMGTLWHVLVPVLKPAMTSCALFQFMWSNNDFMGPLLYVSTPKRYPAAIFVKMSMDADSGFSWNFFILLFISAAVCSGVRSDTNT